MEQQTAVEQFADNVLSVPTKFKKADLIDAYLRLQIRFILPFEPSAIGAIDVL